MKPIAERIFSLGNFWRRQKFQLQSRRMLRRRSLLPVQNTILLTRAYEVVASPRSAFLHKVLQFGKKNNIVGLTCLQT